MCDILRDPYFSSAQREAILTMLADNQRLENRVRVLEETAIRREEVLQATRDAWAESLTITPELIDRCAKRIASWEDGSVWPDSWGLAAQGMRNDARKVLLEAGFVEPRVAVGSID